MRERSSTGKVLLAALAFLALSGCAAPTPRAATPEASPALESTPGSTRSLARAVSSPVSTPPPATPARLLETGDVGEIRQRVVADAARRVGVSPGQIEVLSLERRLWPDTSLGCPEPDRAYAQVITPGYLVVVRAAGQALEYHAADEHVVLCR